MSSWYFQHSGKKNYNIGSRSKSRRHTDSPSSEANQSTRSESTTDKEQQGANGHTAAGPAQGQAAGTANAAYQQSSPHRMQQFANYGPPGASKGPYNVEPSFRGSALLVKTTHGGTVGKLKLHSIKILIPVEAPLPNVKKYSEIMSIIY